ncbi:DegT/DnrJ/EryC1/StrS family aminotransferase [Paracidovorax citrulli]|uniref:DegT/DnrJ/EryC1/StrS aminotransferase n=2 Tax=Paracidovorax citrulli TaxID=80869 RepID=A1TV82_PARC0|nr:DegT/DnrJ/EryC1/StrS family aminotransferase [Paracidovorax citrulli]ABM34870.1 DegT/DnrJ/EryC1/StrS aminotransferase [Paracidovorax citrulli AAC00-1]ATG96573.1 nucleotide sugar aminotransferase [Paracidovorax citrulli]PVY64318.1 dTDP-4-amino-4,6-dideoxygalactose transaminase [Paracidovorax citrulli]QCX10232.1 GDP-perosamine synthase [Paracidovorax citrulli]REG71480.1 dTDP-4-amino-4,6-dideoxygalactose transaminase [Paracidovorax citrulli]
MVPEAPPTAGLPVGWRDLLPGGAADLGSALARFLGVPSVQIECSGTAALVVALTALSEQEPGRDEIIAPAYTCPLVALAAAHCGLRLRVCDLRPASLDLCPNALAALCGPRTLAVLPTHLAGRVTDVAPVRALAHAAGARVIEDAAQALGAREQGGACIGTTGSDMVFFSLAVGKGLTIYEGGALVVADPGLRAACARAARTVAPWRWGWELRRSAELLGYAALYRPAGLPLAYGLPLRRALAQGDRIAAAGDDFDDAIPLHQVGRWRRAVGVRALARLPAWLAEGEARARHRTALLRERVPELHVIEDSGAVAGARGTWPTLLVLLPDAARREAAIAALWGRGLGVSLPFVHALPDYPRYARHVAPGPREGWPHARDFAARVLAIGNSPWLDDAGFDRICALLQQAVRTGG